MCVSSVKITNSIIRLIFSVVSPPLPLTWKITALRAFQIHNLSKAIITWNLKTISKCIGFKINLAVDFIFVALSTPLHCVWFASVNAHSSIFMFYRNKWTEMCFSWLNLIRAFLISFSFAYHCYTTRSSMEANSIHCEVLLSPSLINVRHYWSRISGTSGIVLKADAVVTVSTISLIKIMLLTSVFGRLHWPCQKLNTKFLWHVVHMNCNWCMFRVPLFLFFWLIAMKYVTRTKWSLIGLDNICPRMPF